MPKRKSTARAKWFLASHQRPRGIMDIRLRMQSALCAVYWLHDDTCRDPVTDGYVGSSQRLIERLENHFRNKNFPDVPALKLKILFRGSKRECLDFERGLRPRSGIGWNKGPYAGAGPKKPIKTEL